MTIINIKFKLTVVCPLGPRLLSDHVSQPAAQGGGLGSLACREGSGAFLPGNQALSAERASAVQESVQWLGHGLGVALAKQAVLQCIYRRTFIGFNIVITKPN